MGDACCPSADGARNRPVPHPRMSGSPSGERRGKPVPEPSPALGVPGFRYPSRVCKPIYRFHHPGMGDDPAFGISPPATRLPGGAALPPPRTGYSTRPGTARFAPSTASLRTVRELARCLTRRRSRSRSRQFRPRSRGTTASRESRTRRWHRRCSSHRAGPGCPEVRPCCSMGAGRTPCPWRP